ncbi:MAG: hypothetical protein LUH05_00325 [Candidatus Gastranaerophilales bacterium]|nr:hypothetical protein [Candidatus Gastranaerophilales bacterium]
MSTKQENVQSSTNNYEEGQTVSINGNDYTISSINNDGSITLTDGTDTFTVIQVAEGTEGAVEYDGSWWVEQ